MQFNDMSLAGRKKQILCGGFPLCVIHKKDCFLNRRGVSMATEEDKQKEHMNL